MTKIMTAFGIFAFVAIAGAFFFTSPAPVQASATEVATTCGADGGSCGCATAGACGLSGCSAGGSGCGCGK